MAVTADRTIAQELSEYLVEMSYEALPGDVVAKAKDALLDQLGCQLVGSTMSWNSIIYGVVKGFGGREEATVVNHGFRTFAHDAAFINATFGQGCELDDFVRRGGSPGGHPGAMSVPVALALGEREHVDGKSVITALVAGYETAFRIGQAMPGTRRKGFHNQSVFGAFACTAVAAKILGLDAAQLAQAFAIAGSHACGTTEFNISGGEVKRMHAGLAARAGIQSATLALAGLTGPLTIFEGKRGGVLRCFADQDDPSAMLQDLGKEFGIRYSGYKVFPVAGPIQTPVLALAELIRLHDLTPREVEQIDVGLHERGLTHGGSIQHPQDTIGAQFSLAFSLAIRLLKRSNDLRLYTDPALWQDPEVQAIADKVHAHQDARFVGDKEIGCYVRVTTTDGRVLEREEPYRKGDPQNPITREELVEKFRGLASTVLSPAGTDEVIQTVSQLDQLDDVTDLVAHLQTDHAK